MVWWWVLGSALVIMVGRRWLRSVEQPSEGDGPTPSREGSSATGGTNQVWSRAQTLGLGSVGKGLATGSERRNFHGLVETLFWRLKRGTQHGGSINASVRAHKHTVSLSFTLSHTKPTNSWEEGYSHRHITIATAYLTFEPKWRHFGLKPGYLFFQLMEVF